MPADHFLTDEHKVRFLSLLRQTGNKSVSARAIGFSPATLERHRQADDEFAQEWAEAIDEAADALEEAARARAVEGVTREKYIGPKEGGKYITEVQYSDAMLLRLLEANKPDKFANRSKTEVSNPDGSLAAVLDDTQLAVKLASLLAMAQARANKEAE